MSDSPETAAVRNRTWEVKGTYLNLAGDRLPFTLWVTAPVLSAARDLTLQTLGESHPTADPKITTIELLGGDLVTPGEYDDFVGPPIERDEELHDDAIPGPLGHNYPPTAEDLALARSIVAPATLSTPRAEYAEKILLHYFKTVWDAAGLPWNSDNEVEIIGAIEDIVKAARR